MLLTPLLCKRLHTFLSGLGRNSTSLGWLPRRGGRPSAEIQRLDLDFLYPPYLYLEILPRAGAGFCPPAPRWGARFSPVHFRSSGHLWTLGKMPHALCLKQNASRLLQHSWPVLKLTTLQNAAVQALALWSIRWQWTVPILASNYHASLRAGASWYEINKKLTLVSTIKKWANFIILSVDDSR